VPSGVRNAGRLQEIAVYCIGGLYSAVDFSSRCAWLYVSDIFTLGVCYR